MKRNGGFTLIELMIAMAIVAILTTLAVSSYEGSVQRGKRSEAVAALLQGAQQLERYYSAHGSYKDPGTNALAAVFSTLVPASGTAYYTIAAQGQTATTFTLRATHVGAMSADKCGDFEITETGAINAVNYTGFSTLADADAYCIRR